MHNENFKMQGKYLGDWKPVILFQDTILLWTNKIQNKTSQYEGIIEDQFLYQNRHSNVAVAGVSTIGALGGLYRRE